MDQEIGSTVELQVAYRRKPGEKLTERLTPGPNVLLRLLRGRFTPEQANLRVELSGPDGTVQRTIEGFLHRSVDVRVVRS
jgi:hypothetical protein